MWTALAAAALQAATPAGAAPEQACPPGAAAARIPPELAGWTKMRPVRAGANATNASAVEIGRGARATLLPMAQLRFAVPPEKAPAGTGSGGLFAFTVAAAGRYRVALGAGAWVDVVRDGAVQPSVAHGHGPACSAVRKMVDFDLKPGRYLLQVAGNRTPDLDLMVARLR